MKLFKVVLVLTFFMLCISYNVLALENEDCLSCHEDNELTGLNQLEEEVSMFVDEAMFSASVHADLNCVDCHTDLEDFDDYVHNEELKKVECSSCHDDIAEVYSTSVHGIALESRHAATCASCHGTHNILPYSDPNAMTSPGNLPKTCSDCHTKIRLSEDPDIKKIDQYDRYMRGVHAEGISKGIGSSASCDDCHGIHDLKRSTDPQSKVHKMNIPSTCAQCHNDVFIKYSRGIHGKALAAGIMESPDCTDCHGEHEILEIEDPNSQVNSANLSDYVCGRCHNDPVIVEKFGLSKDRFTSYQDTYHGLAITGGSVKAATCASCHKAHDILPSTNPASSTHSNNITETCAKCHIDANDTFAGSYTHETSYPEYDNINNIVKKAYIVLIVVVIGGMLIHNLIILGYFFSEKRRHLKKKKLIKRFSGHLVVQHMLLTITFIVLVITGFALRYPDEWWVSILNFFGVYEDARGVIHRISAVGLCLVSIHHGLFLVLSRRGKRHLKELLPFPLKQELQLIVQNLKFHLRMTKERPHNRFYDYTEKAEYWALVWGTILMAFTGFVLWFPTFFTEYFPPWIVKISETVHFYEAWLATLAIGVFHFFFVIFHPEQYPMSFTWLNGKMTDEEAKHHHPEWHNKIKDEDKANWADLNLTDDKREKE